MIKLTIVKPNGHVVHMSVWESSIKRAIQNVDVIYPGAKVRSVVQYAGSGPIHTVV